METEPGTVNKELRQDYIPTNNTLSSPALRLQSLCIREPVAKETSSCAQDRLGGLLQQGALQQKPEERSGLARWRNRVDKPGREKRKLGAE